jgi:DNA-binding NarL/FixJ family response regulator
MNAARTSSEVLIVDRHPVSSYGLTAAIRDCSGLAVADRAHSGSEALDRIEACAPDLATLDLELHHSSALTLIETIKASHENTDVLALSEHEEPFYAEHCLRVGADGYVIKSEPVDTIIDALKTIGQGNVALSDSVVTQIARGRIRGNDEGSSMSQLSRRELEVFELIGQGNSTREIAERLHLSPKTVHYYRDQVKRKLDLDDATELVHRAYKWAYRDQILGADATEPSA